MGIFIGNQAVRPLGISSIYVGNQKVYEGYTPDLFILDVTIQSPGTDGEYGSSPALIISTDNKGATVTFSGTTYTIPPNSVNYEQELPLVRDNIVISGGFTNCFFNYSNSGQYPKKGVIIHGINTWYQKQTVLFDKLFFGQAIDFPINLPNQITEIGPQTFAVSNLKTTFLTGSALNFGNQLKTLTNVGRDISSFFSNAQTINNMWIINDVIFAETSNIKSDTTIQIPNGARVIPREFCRIGSTVAYAYTSVIIPATVRVIGTDAFRADSGATVKLTEITFNQSKNTPIELENLAFNLVKSTHAVNIYTDYNPNILNFDWGNSKINPTFYALDRTTVITQTPAPTLSINNTTLNILPNDTGQTYRLTISYTPVLESIKIFDEYVTAGDFDFTEYTENKSSLTLSVYAQKDNYAAAPKVTATWTAPTEA